MSRGRRGNGEGHIGQRKDGRWEARWTEVVDGQPRRRSAYARTRREAAEKLRLAQQRMDAGEPTVEARLTFRSVAERWRQTARIRQGIKSTTLQTYTSALKRQVYPVIGDLPIRDVGPDGVARVLQAMADAGLSGSYQHVVHKSMSAVFRMAADDGLIRANPCSKVRAQPVGRSTKVVPEREQVRAMIEAAEEARTRVFLVILAHTGLRISEALSLRWADWRGKTLVVRDGKGSKPRAVPVSAALAAELSQWRKEQAAEQLRAVWWEPQSDWIVTNGVGRPWDGRNARRAYKALADKHCPGASPHSMRHAAATMLLEEGVPLKVVSEVLGHSSIRVTADTYSHVTARALEGASDALDRALGG